MKTLIASSALALAALTGTAHAAGTVSEAQIQQIRSYAPNVDVSALTFAEAQSALNIIASSDSKGEAQLKLNGLLR
jgi:hypothetical protein